MENSIDFMCRQRIEIEELIKNAFDDPIILPQLESQLYEIQDKIRLLNQQSGKLFPQDNNHVRRAAIFIKGNGVDDASGIKLSLAGNLLTEYDKMYAEQAIHDERCSIQSAGKSRRRKGSIRPELMLINTPKGSFGFEFTPQSNIDQENTLLHYKSLKNLALNIEKLCNATSGSDSFAESVQDFPPKIIPSLKRFFTALSKQESEIRFSFDDLKPIIIASDKVNSVNARLEIDIIEESLTIEGLMRGVLLDSGRFEIITSSDQTISGFVTDEATEDDLIKYNSFTNKRCNIKLIKTTIKEQNGSEKTPSYVLEEATLIEDNPTTFQNVAKQPRIVEL